MDRKLEEKLREGIIVERKQSDKLYSDSITLTTATNPVREVDIAHLVGGPARFVRLVVSINSRLFIRKMTAFGTEDPEREMFSTVGIGAPANVPVILEDEAITCIRVVPAVYPVTVVYVASR